METATTISTTTSTNGSGGSSQAGAAQRQTEPSSGASALTSDFQTFLTMLTVQMENQDPLNPTNSTDFAVQLATFSGVEQQVQTNELLESMLSDQAFSGLAGYADWVGQEARAPVSATYDGTPVDLYLDLPTETDQASLTVRDADGSTVSVVAMAPDADTFTWDGTDAGGVPVAYGQYSFTVEALSEGASIATTVPEVYAPVREVRLENGQPVIVLEGEQTVGVGEVTGIRG